MSDVRKQTFEHNPIFQIDYSSFMKFLLWKILRHVQLLQTQGLVKMTLSIVYLWIYKKMFMICNNYMPFFELNIELHLNFDKYLEYQVTTFIQICEKICMATEKIL